MNESGIARIANNIPASARHPLARTNVQASACLSALAQRQ